MTPEDMQVDRAVEALLSFEMTYQGAVPTSLSPRNLQRLRAMLVEAIRYGYRIGVRAAEGRS